MRLEDINLRNPVKIGYYDPFDAFPPIRDEFVSKFPLSNLHWRYNPLKPIKSIPLLPVELEEEFPSLHTKKKPGISEPLSNVYTRLMFIHAADIDTPAGKKDKKSTMIKTSIFDKLKIDFGPGGKQISLLDMPLDVSDSTMGTRENILKVREEYVDDISKLEVYNEVIGTIKSSILHTFNQRFIESSSAIEKLQITSKQNPGDRLKLFQEKLKLASTFNDMRCLDESLELYEDLFLELRKLDLGVTEKTSMPAILKSIDYQNFDPENVSNDMTPYFQFCQAVNQRIPIDVYAVKLGLFLQISILLQSLSNFATSISISSIFISSILQKAIALLNDFSQSYPDSVEVDQWLFSMADFYLSLPLAQKLVELDKEQTENQVSSNSVTGILEYSAELKLLKRSILNKLATMRGFESPTACLFLVDVSLQEGSSEAKTHNEFELVSNELALSLGDQESYEDRFKQLTISAIQDYASCERIKTIDILSIDLAMLHYRRNEYKEALEILQNSYDYFIQNGWNYVGGMLLDIFLDCVQHTEPGSNEQFLRTTLKLFSSLNNKEGSPHGINDYNIVKNKSERLKLFHKLTSISESLESSHEFSLEDIFIVDVEPYINIRDGDGRYFIRVIIKNKFGIQIELPKVAVTLKSAEDSEGNTVDFMRRNVLVSEDDHTIVELYTNKFSSEIFKVDKEGKVIPSKNGLSNLALQMFPFPDQFRLEIVSPRKINLGSCSLECVVHTGPKSVNNLSLVVSASTNGLKIYKETNDFSFDEVKANDKVNILFSCNTDSKMVEIQVMCRYEIDGEKFEYYLQDSYDLNLKISISVQDIFRAESIYSKFQIGCVSSQSPVRVNKCDYSCPKGKYKVTGSSTGKKKDMSIVVYGEQPAYLFYKLEPTTDDFNPTDVLDFTIQYSDLQKECEQIVQKALRKSLKNRTSQRYYFLLAPIILKLQFDLLRFSVDKTVFASNVNHCSVVMNEKISNHVPPENKEELTDILLSLFRDEILIKPEDTDSSIDENELYIPVSVPYLNMLHHTEFLLEEKSHYVVGGPIDTTLVINSSSKWSDLSSGTVLASSSPRQKLTTPRQAFELTILNEEDWIISGLKRQTFWVDEGEATTKVKICLIPLNAGELVLPKVAIKSVSDEACAMELVLENALETVLVIPELEDVTFAF
ncbi:hypothetical protein JCM33374_g2827 [Metschnikowia sp. JCM 33374]|nr:hypothetical protein JCM33374_g2827 [Metschnikowia sp. JCM 33374]